MRISFLALSVAMSFLLLCNTSFALQAPNTSFARVPFTGRLEAGQSLPVAAEARVVGTEFVFHESTLKADSFQINDRPGLRLDARAGSFLLPPLGVTGFVPNVSSNTFRFKNGRPGLGLNFAAGNSNGTFSTRPGFGGPITASNTFATMIIVMNVRVFPSSPDAPVGSVDGNVTIGDASVTVETIPPDQDGNDLRLRAVLPGTSEASAPNPNPPVIITRGFTSATGFHEVFVTTQRVMLTGEDFNVLSSSEDTQSPSFGTGTFTTSFTGFFYGKDFLTSDTGGGGAGGGTGGTGGGGAGGVAPQTFTISEGVGTGVGRTLGFGTRDESPIQAIKNLDRVTAMYAKNLEDFTPSIRIVAEGPPALTVEVEAGDEGVTYDPTTGEAEFDLTTHGPFEPGYYNVEVSDDFSYPIYVPFLGDVNLDGLVNQEDVVVVETSLENPEAFQNALLTDGDVDCDGVVSNTDLLLLNTLLPPEFLLGDANGDGAVNNIDIGSFGLALLNRPAYELMFPDFKS